MSTVPLFNTSIDDEETISETGTCYEECISTRLDCTLVVFGCLLGIVVAGFLLFAIVYGIGLLAQLATGTTISYDFIINMFLGFLCLPVFVICLFFVFIACRLFYKLLRCKLYVPSLVTLAC